MAYELSTTRPLARLATPWGRSLGDADVPSRGMPTPCSACVVSGRVGQDRRRRRVECGPLDGAEGLSGRAPQRPPPQEKSHFS
jgi:hypothetical protein